MESREVQCIEKTDRSNPHERIAKIGGKLSDGSSWTLSEGDAIAKIEKKECEFHTLDNKKKPVKVVIATHKDHKYLKTEADDQQPDNLLALPACR
jgi:hypothetical protein